MKNLSPAVYEVASTPASIFTVKYCAPSHTKSVVPGHQIKISEHRQDCCPHNSGRYSDKVNYSVDIMRKTILEIRNFYRNLVDREYRHLIHAATPLRSSQTIPAWITLNNNVI
jgi:hypothetical protein